MKKTHITKFGSVAVERSHERREVTNSDFVSGKRKDVPGEVEIVILRMEVEITEGIHLAVSYELR